MLHSFSLLKAAGTLALVAMVMACDNTPKRLPIMGELDAVTKEVEDVYKRQGIYNYHRLGLDTVTETPGLARKKAMELLTTMKQVAQLRPGAVVVNSFFDAKSEELYNMFREASPDDRQQAFTMLSSCLLYTSRCV